MQTPAFWSHMREYWLNYWGLGDSDRKSAPPSALSQLLEHMDQTTYEMLEVSQVRAQEEAKARQEAEEARLIEHQTDRLAQDMVALHGQLRTGLQQPELTLLAKFISHHWQEAGLFQPPAHLAEVALQAIALRLQRESLAFGWERLMASSPEWPPPIGLSPHADEQERREHTRLEQQNLRNSFVTSPFVRFSDLIVGRVPVWRAVFPEYGGPVWRHTVLEGVAGALAGQRLRELDEKAHQLRPELESLLGQALDKPMRKIEESMRLPFASLQEEKLLAAEAKELCQRQAPDLVWQMLSQA